MNRVLPVAGLILLVGLATILVAPSLIDWNQYRGRVAAEAKRLTGRALVIDGDVDFDLLPIPSLSLSGVRLASTPGASVPDMIYLPRLDLQVAFLPLLMGEVQIKEVQLVRPNLVFEVTAEGEANWRFGPAMVAGFDLFESWRVFTERMSVRDAVVRYIDIPGNREFTVDALSAEVSARTPRGPFRIEGQAEYEREVAHFQVTVGAVEKGRAFPVSLDTYLERAGLSTLFTGIVTEATSAGRFDGKLLMSAADGSVAMAQMVALASPIARELTGFGWLGSPLSVSGDEAGFEAGLTAGLDTLEFRNFEFTSGVADASGHLRFEFGSAPLLDAKLRITGKKLQAGTDNSAGLPQTPALWPSAIEILEDLADASLDVEAQDIVYQGLPVSRAYLKGEGGDGVYRFDQLRAELADGTVARLAGEMRIKGGRPAFEGEVQVSGGTLSHLLPSPGGPLQASAAGADDAVSLSAEILASDAEMNLDDLDIVFGESRVSGYLRTIWGRRPVIQADLRAAHLDLDGLLGSTGGGEKASATFASDWPVLGRLLALSAQADWMAVVNAGEVTANGIRLREVTGQGEATGGVVSLADLSWSGEFGGRVSLSGMVAPGHGLPLSAIEVSGDGFDLDTFLRAAGLPAGVAGLRPGAANFKGRLTTASSSQGGLRASAKLEGDWQHVPFAMEGSIFGDTKSVDVAFSLMQDSDTFSVLGLVKEPLGHRDFALNVKADVRSAAQFLGLDPEPEPAVWGLDRPARLDLRLSGDREAIAINTLTALLDGDHYTGAGTLALSGMRPELTLSLNTDALRFEETAVFPQEEAAGSSMGAFGPALLELGAYLDGQVAIEAQRLLTPHHEIADPRFQLSFREEQFSVESLTGRVFGGALNLSAFLTRSRAGPRLALKGQILRARLEEATNDIWAASYAEGPFNAAWELAGDAQSLQSFTRTMIGEASIAGDRAVVQGLDITRLANEIDGLSRVEDLRPLVGSLLNAGTTRLDRFSGMFAIDEGVARAGSVTFDGEGVQGAARLIVDLANGTLDARTRLVLQGTQAPWPALVVDYEGDIKRPRRAVELAALEAELAQRVLAASMEDAEGDASALLRGAAGDEKLVPPVNRAERAVRNVPVGIPDAPVHEANQRDREPLALP